MRTLLLLHLVAWLASESLALATGFSAPTNGIYIAIVGDSQIGVTNEPVRAIGRLIWRPCCDTNEVWMRFPLDPAYLVKVRMFDSSGKEVSKTSLGSQYGSKFDRLSSYGTTRLQRMGTTPYQDNPGLGGGSYLAPPNQLFRMGAPGVYTMEIELQMFRYVTTTNANEWVLMRFPPAKIQVEKYPDD